MVGGGGLQQGWMRQQAVPVFQVGQAAPQQAPPLQGTSLPSRFLSPSQPYPPYQPPPPASLPPQPYMRLISNDELDYHSRMQVQQADAEKLQNQQQILSIGTHIRTCFEAARNAKQQSIQPRLLKCLRQRLGEYEADELSLIQSRGGSEVFIMITNIKCRALESWCRDILRPPGGKPFSLNATPIPTLSPQLEQRLVVEAQREILEAGAPISSEELRTRIEKMKEKLSATYDEEGKKRADKLEEKTDDDFKEGGWYSALDSLLYDIATFPTAFLKGPTIRRKARIVWDHSQDLMNPEMRVEKKLVKEYDRVSPFDIFPSPGARTLQDGYLLERDSISRSELASLAGTPGYHSEQIRLCLQHYGRTGYREWDYQDQERARLESREEEYTSDPEGKMDSLIFWGSVQGSLLIEWGMREHVSAERRPGAMVTKVEPIEPEREYQVCARAVGQYVIKAIVNPDPLGNRPYYSASFENVPGSIWGKALPEVMAPEQYMCNAAARSVVNNMGMACLTGDTVVYRHASNGRKYSEVTLLELWNKKKLHNSGLRRIKLRSLDEENGTFISNRIVDIVDNGIAEVYEIKTENGYVIKATGNHRFMRDDGEWQELDSFDVGDLVAVNGQVVPLPKKCIECGADTATRGVRCRSCASKAHNSKWNQEQIRKASTNKEANETTARARHECKIARKNFCEECGINNEDNLDVKLEVHHKDRDPFNNTKQNLQSLCSKCHHSLHAFEDSLGNPYLHKYLSYDRIVSIDFVGKERVFDLCMTGPNHNFVANGFVSHNSGPQVAITDASRLMPGEKSDEFSPWKVWQFKRDPNGGSAIPIQFFSPNPMTDMLLKVYDYWAKQAGESTGIPNYVYGMSESSGAARTATGLSMLMNAAGKGIKSVIFHIDDGITVPSVRQHAYHVMLYDSDSTLKGDVFVVPRGSTALIVEEQRQIRLNEFMSLALRSPIILEILGKPAMAELVRSAVESLDIDLSGLIPDEDAVVAEQEQQKVVAMLGVLSERLGIPMEVMAQALMEAGQGQGGGQGGAGGGNVRQSPPLQGGNGAAGPPIIAPQQMNQAGVRGGGADFQAMMARAGNGGGVQ